jgi:hypothetical protein
MGWCAECAEPFTIIDQLQTRYCSKTCSTRAGRARRRAVEAGAFVAPVIRRQVYERDRWRCHLCGRKVMPAAKVPHPLAPTLDHVVPLAAGGAHEPANMRTAHFLCNSTKGARGGTEQLALFG